MSTTQSSVFADTKKHFEILDGLRGVAALMVILFHLFEAFSDGNHLVQIINHGYLAVDFFFVLSGFVVGYAYDDRWNKMTIKGFFKRRLIRLHPMIVMGMLIGALFFYLSDSPEVFPNLGRVSIGSLMLVMFIGMTLFPLPPSMDIHGWREMHPLNGPAWSLFYEYVANILYALFIRRFSKKVLTIFVVVAGLLLIHFAITGKNGDMAGGWSLKPVHVRIGFTRLLYPFFAGLLLSRVCVPGKIKHAFLICSLLIIGILVFPRVGGADTRWMNGVYESFCIIVCFPLIVFMGASGKVEGKYSTKVCRFLGDISYPIYIIHYPLIYVFTAWVSNNNVSMVDAVPMALLVFVGSIVMAYLLLKFYDEPVRRWLSNRFLSKRVKR